MEEETRPSRWEETVAAFVEAHLPGPPSRVLDVGCGSGWLTQRLAAQGHEVRGIDPDAPEGPLFDRTTLEDFPDPGPFDAIVAVLSLHHLHDLEAGVGRIADLLEADRTVVVVEFAWDRCDDVTVMWCLDRFPAEPDPDNWLHERCGELRERYRAGRPLEVKERFRRWAAEEGFHSSSAILQALRNRFRQRSFAWSPYLFQDLEGVTEADEQAAIDSGTIQATGFRFVGEGQPQDGRRR